MNNSLIVADKIKQKAKCIHEEADNLMTLVGEQTKKIRALEEENKKLKEQIKPNKRA